MLEFIETLERNHVKFFLAEAFVVIMMTLGGL